MKRRHVIVIFLLCSFTLPLPCQQNSIVLAESQEQGSDSMQELTDNQISQLVFDARQTGILTEKLEVPRIMWLSMVAHWMMVKYLQCAQWMRTCWGSLKIGSSKK